jgi:hypothetical protein
MHQVHTSTNKHTIFFIINVSLYFILFSMKKLFNIQYLLQFRSKHYKTTLVHSYSLRAFQWYKESGRGHLGLGEISTVKQK